MENVKKVKQSLKLNNFQKFFNGLKVKNNRLPAISYHLLNHQDLWELWWRKLQPNIHAFLLHFPHLILQHVNVLESLFAEENFCAILQVS